MRLLAYYSRIISRSGKTYALFFCRARRYSPDSPANFTRFQTRIPDKHMAVTVFSLSCGFHAALALFLLTSRCPFSRMRLLPFFLSFGSCRFPACRRCRFIFHSALAVLPFREISEGFFVALEAFARYGFFGDIG